MHPKNTNLTPIPIEDIHEAFFNKEEFHPRGFNYITLNNPTETYFATDYLQRILDERWDLGNIDDFAEITSPDYWDSFTNNLLSSRLSPYSDLEDSERIVDLSLHHEFIVYLKSVNEGYLCSIVLYNSGTLLEEESVSQPFSELPKYFTGNIYSALDALNYLISGKPPEAYKSPVDIPDKVIKKTMSKLDVLKNEFDPLFKEFEKDDSSADWVWANWKMKELNKERHEIILGLIIKYRIFVPGYDCSLANFVDGIYSEIFTCVSECKHPIIQELYSNWNH